MSSLTSLVLAFGLAQAIATTYMLTFRGMSYSRNFVQGIPLGAIVTCMLLMAIGDSIAAGIGLAGGLSIIRFRTTMRDPRDMVFIFAGLAVGIVCGLRAYPAGITGTAVFCVAVLLMDRMAYGARHQFDALVRLVSDREASDLVVPILAKHTDEHVLVTLREAAQGQALEHAYQLKITSNPQRIALVQALEATSGIRDVRLYLQEPTQEL
jgi:uncharacterized membrane protein YhiD involved in acid resistance